MAQYIITGGFHFLWECLTVVLQMFWGSLSHVGSLCTLRECRVQVDKTAKVFSVCDEFVLHAYRSHFLAAICTQLKFELPDAAIQHEPTLQWLSKTAEAIVSSNLYPTYFEDTVYTPFTALFYIQLFGMWI